MDAKCSHCGKFLERDEAPCCLVIRRAEHERLLKRAGFYEAEGVDWGDVLAALLARENTVISAYRERWRTVRIALTAALKEQEG